MATQARPCHPTRGSRIESDARFGYPSALPWLSLSATPMGGAEGDSPLFAAERSVSERTCLGAAKRGQSPAVPMDYEVQRCTRRCRVTDRELKPGETHYSVLVAEQGELLRYDYSAEAWQGPPQGAIGWWKAEIPSPSTKKKHWAPNDVMLQFFDELEKQEDKQDVRYVLALLLVRRRVMRHEETRQDDQGREDLVLYCPRREETYHVPAVVPDETRVEEIQEELASLLK